jgi:hypothetical protein
MTWHEQCPLRGICPECGIEFAWVEVLRPMMYQLPWYAEHAKSMWARFKRTPGTLRRMILPHHFWGELGVTKRVSILGLLLWCVPLVLITHLLVAIPSGWARWESRNWSGASLDQYILTYGYYGYAKILFDGIAFPLWYALPQSSGYILSLEVHQFDGFTNLLVYELVMKPIGYQLGFIITWLVVLLAIPHTRRLAKIRNAHIARVTLLSTLMMLLSYEVHKVFFAMEEFPGSFPLFAETFQPIFSLLMMAWQVAFWACAISIGWQVRPARLLVTLGSIAAVLGGVTLMVCLFVVMSA